MKRKNPQAIIQIDKLKTDVFLGALEKERSKSQEIVWQITIFFSTAPLGCKSDNLKDTLCYDSIAQTVVEVCKAQKYHLIEHLVMSLHDKIRENFGEINMRIKASKVICQSLSYTSSFELIV